MNLLKRSLDFLLFSNIFIGACAVALTFTNQLTVEDSFHLNAACWFVFFSTILVYSSLKFRTADEPVELTAHRAWATKHPQASRNVFLISLIGALAFFFQLNSNMQWMVLALALFTAFYGFIEIPFTRPKIKLRHLGLVKTLFVAIVWSVTTVILPLCESYTEPAMMVFLLLRRFLFILALTMVFEIKDIKGDRQNQLHTLPSAIGVTNTKLLAQGILMGLIALNIAQYFFFDIPLLNMLAVNTSLLLSILCIQPVNEETSERWYYLVLDGMMILQFALVYAATQI